MDGLPWSPAQSPLLRTPDSSQDLCPGCPGTCPTRGLWMTATALRDQIEIAEHSARRTLCTVFFCSATIPYCHTPRGQSFLCSLSGHQPHTAHRVCSSVSGSPGDIGWYFCPPPLPPPKALLGHSAILHIPAGLTHSYITAIHQVEGISVP